MTRRCEVTGKSVLSGNNVSHANNKTRRRFLPNLQVASFYSTILKRQIKIRATTNGIRTVEHNGGIDSYLLSRAPSKLTADLRKVRKEITARQAA